MGKRLGVNWLVQYNAEASEKKEKLAREHARWRDIIFSIDTIQSNDLDKNSTWLKNKIYFRIFKIELEPQIVVKVIFDLEVHSVVKALHFAYACM